MLVPKKDIGINDLGRELKKYLFRQPSLCRNQEISLVKRMMMKMMMRIVIEDDSLRGRDPQRTIEILDP